MLDQDAIHDAVRARYGEAARIAAGLTGSPAPASCCGPAGTADVAGVLGELLYTGEDRAWLPDAALLASLGCGNPIAVAELGEGERVLDLGSGGGIDVILSARRVGPTGRAFGLDMTDEMLALAVRNAADAGVANVEFVRGTIEAIPLPASTIDVVISNCVINLAADKAAVFREIARVLRPGGRVGVSDIRYARYLHLLLSSPPVDAGTGDRSVTIFARRTRPPSVHLPWRAPPRRGPWVPACRPRSSLRPCGGYAPTTDCADVAG